METVPEQMIAASGQTSPAQRRAVIDVGTNSVKLLVADIIGKKISPVHEESRQTRLGRGFYETHRLQSGAILKTAEAVAEFAKTAREKQAATIRVIATSAARDAVNPQELTSAIERASKLKTEIISGAREAEWAFQGATSDAELARQPLLLLDVGGGSTEFILGHEQKKRFAHSFPLGTVRMMEKFPHQEPPTANEFAACCNWLKRFLRHEIRPQLESILKSEAASVQLAGTGGTATILARMELKIDFYDRERIEAMHLTLAQIKTHCEKLWSLPLAERQKIVGLPKNRADVILSGVLIYECVMEEFGFEELRVSTRGLRFAALMD